MKLHMLHVDAFFIVKIAHNTDMYYASKMRTLHMNPQAGTKKCIVLITYAQLLMP